jgi:hypothetical protein
LATAFYVSDLKKKKILVVIENTGIWLVSNEKIERNQLKTLD